MEDSDVVTLDKANEVIEPLVTPLLEPLGFEQTSRLMWVRSADAPVRQVFTFSQWKGGAMAPRWGLSLDFVPHLSGKSLKWHRTAKSALLDLAVDPRDQELDIRYVNGVKRLAEEASEAVPKAIALARQFWSQFDRVENLPAAISYIREHLKSGGLGFYNYSQHPVAAAMVYAKNGLPYEGKSELELFVQRSRLVPRVREQLVKLFEAAAEEQRHA